MFFAPLLKLRDQIARKRNQLTMDEEKPFLSHLEDLRKTLTRMILTLITGVILCFAFNEWFFAIVRDPLRRAGLEAPRERNLPAVVAALPESQQQPTWWRIHNAARGAAALEGPQRQLFLDSVAPTPLDRQLTNAVLLHHTASILPEADRKAYLAKATALLLPAEDGPKVLEFTAQLVAAKTSPDLDVPADMVETEAFAPAESFMLSMKLSLVAGIIICFPLLFYFLLEFILPGLTDRERRLLWPSLVIGFGLFLSGVLFAFYFVVPRALEFFHEYSNSLGIRDRWRIGQYISFVTTFSLIFGLAFELPVIVMAMVKLGLLESTTMRRTRSWAVIIILAASAILTPTGDMLTMSMLAGPMVIMYEACIWLAVLHEKKERQREEAERANDMSRRAALVGVASVQARSPSSPDPDPDSPSDPYHASDPYHHDHHDPHSQSGQHGQYGHGPNHDPHHDSDHHWHPHHPDPETQGPDAEYEQYLREHAHLYNDAHPENTPVEARPATTDSSESPPDSTEPAPTPEPTLTPESPASPELAPAPVPEPAPAPAPEPDPAPPPEPPAPPSA